jgi:hypothetical protein
VRLVRLVPLTPSELLDVRGSVSQTVDTGFCVEPEARVHGALGDVEGEPDRNE